MAGAFPSLASIAVRRWLISSSFLLTALSSRWHANALVRDDAALAMQHQFERSEKVSIHARD